MDTHKTIHAHTHIYIAVKNHSFFVVTFLGHEVSGFVLSCVPDLIRYLATDPKVTRPSIHRQEPLTPCVQTTLSLKSWKKRTGVF